MIVSPLDNPTIFLAHPQLLQPKFQQRSSDLFRGFADDPCHLRRAVRACHCEASWFLGWWNKRHSMQVTLQWYTSNTTEVNYHTCRLLWYHYIVHIPDMEHMGPRKKPIKPNYMYTYIYILRLWAVRLCWGLQATLDSFLKLSMVSGFRTKWTSVVSPTLR